MCGIVGYLGNNKASEVILSGLEKLEYRGYDSCGICFFDVAQEAFVTYKDIGRVFHLVNDFNYQYENHLAIGHTRWATHGKPNQLNSHPHFSQNKRFAIVHNGVIENYRELTKKYLPEVHFISETDTEVIVNMIELFVKDMTVEEAIRKTLSLIEGSYALLVIDTHHPECLYAAKNKSPLLIGTGKNGITLASDIMALVGYADQYMPIGDKTFTVCKKDDYGHYIFEIYDIIGLPIHGDFLRMDLILDEIGKAGYSHYMLKEICEQPSVIRNIMEKYLSYDKFTINPEILHLLKSCDRIYILAAGTSMHAGLVGKYLFENIAKIPCEVNIASEFAYNSLLLTKNPVFIFISQSGETADLRACLVKVRELGYKTLTITNVLTSTLAREADHYLEIFAGPEIAVASTKAYVGQIVLLAILSYCLSENKPFDLKLELSKIAVAMEAIIENRDVIHTLVKERIVKRNCFYIGRGLDYYTCLEAALKLKEISYIQTEGFAAGELKHGTIALIEEGVPVIGIISQHAINNSTRANIREVMARGANKIIISLNRVSDPSDEIILMNIEEMLSPILTVVPTQLIAFFAALELGKDIDKPRNLAKSVTVE
ncbi:MAG: glutamine--fructose-6-phosphate transaminase (isomerizing) [Candidatus Izemoplasmatales bacterium]|nr:glutamine--fructose-6-phosphate transaminase (isomerizing) [Candidatus Izemoplasmatales bacterium]